ncbi:MAG: transposase [Deltaproteobacteria bacterium]|nr:transposase [Deltaproteobacteria bacterium]
MEFGGFAKILKWQCLQTGWPPHEDPKIFPSSKSCSACQHVPEEFVLKTREQACPEGGALTDRNVSGRQ